MNFLLLAWRTKESNLWTLHISQWQEVAIIAKQTATRHQLDLINIGLYEENLELFFFGKEYQINKFIESFRHELYKYLSGISNNYQALSNVYLLEDISEEAPKLIRAIRARIISNWPFYHNQIPPNKFLQIKPPQSNSPP